MACAFVCRVWGGGGVCECGTSVLNCYCVLAMLYDALIRLLQQSQRLQVVAQALPRRPRHHPRCFQELAVRCAVATADCDDRCVVTWVGALVCCAAGSSGLLRPVTVIGAVEPPRPLGGGSGVGAGTGGGSRSQSSSAMDRIRAQVHTSASEIWSKAEEPPARPAAPSSRR